MGRGPKYHGYGVQYTMGRGFDMPYVEGKIPWIGGSIYHGNAVQNTIGRGSDIPWIVGSIYDG